MKKNFVFNLIQIIFSLVGLGLIIAGYFAKPGSLTDDGFPLSKFFYLMGGFFIVWPMVLFGVIRYFTNRAAARYTWLKENGIKGKARVTAMRRTALTVNNIPQMQLDLDVTTSLGEKFQTSYKKCIDPVYYALLRPDTDLPVYIDPNDRKKLIVDFEEAWAKMGEVNRGNFPGSPIT